MKLKAVRFAFVAMLCVAAFGVGSGQLGQLARPAHADNAITVSDLKGSWQAALLWSNSGCGPMSGLLNFTLDSTGNAPSATLVGHAGAAPGCGDQTTTQTFTIKSLNPDGSGTAGLTCGAGCGWEFNIQVDRKATIFNMVDVNPNNPDNYVSGTAIRQTAP